MLKICLYQGYNVPLCRHIKTQNYRTYQSNTIYGQSKYSINAEDNTDIGTLISGMVSLTEKKASLNGNISSIIWRDSTQTASRGYRFTYDSMNRLTDAVYGEGPSLSDNTDRYSERGMTYTKNGALTRLLRYGRRNTDDFGLVDSLVMTLDGNGSLSVDPYKGFAFEYDLLGNLKQTESEYTTSYVYSSTGERLSVESKFNGCIAKPHKFFFSDWEEDGVVFNSTSDDSGDSDIMDRWSKMMYPRDTEFCGPFIFEYSVLDKFLFDGGYCTFKDGQAIFHYYLTDHLGNNRAVVSEAGTVEQTTEYYPFGGIYGDVSTNSGLQPYKYNGKEFDHYLGLDLYDYGARLYDPALVVWTGVDPLADEYGGISPYVYCLSNPVNNIDTDGKKVRPQGPEVLNMIVATLPKENRLYVAMDKDGYINNWLINNYKGNDYNTNCLKELVNNEMTMDVFITPNFAWKVGTQYRFSEEIYNLPNPYPFGEISINPDTNPLCNLEDLSTGEEGMMGKTLFPDDVGVQNSTNDNVQVYINPKLSLKGKAEIYSHEANGHVLRYFRNGYDHKNASHEIINGTERNNVLKQMILKSKIETINNFRK